MSGLDLPLLWAGILALAVLLYVVLDGFDLGVGILFPFARSSEDRDVMMNTIAPVWDGNETWLVLGGGGLLAAFPLAYSVLMPALYLPILLMLLALILRGVAFEFRFRARSRGRAFWTALFAAGSFGCAFSQGLVLGGFIQGVTVADGRFAGGPLDWLTPYTVLVALGVTAGYALLGATWIVMKTADELHGDAHRWARRAGVATAVLLGAVSAATLFVHPRIAARWGIPAIEDRDGETPLTAPPGSDPGEVFSADPEVLTLFDPERLLALSPVPLLGVFGFAVLAWGLHHRKHYSPFVGSLLLFLSGFVGLAVSFTPYIVPYALTFEQAAAADNALALLAAVMAVLLPLILVYTGWVYFVFRGKVLRDAGYH